MTERTAPRDPRKEPKVGDIVEPIGPAMHVGAAITYNALTVRARVDQLVAFTEDVRSRQVIWILVEDWCEVFEPISEWRVIHAAD